MSLDFALKDFYRKRRQNYPYVLVIAFVVAFTEYFALYTINFGFGSFLKGNDNGIPFFSGSIRSVYIQFNEFILYLIIILCVVVTTITAITFILSKRRDLAIMRSIGTLPGNLHGFYLIEVIIIFFIAYFIGLVLGLFSFGIHLTVALLFGAQIQVQFNVIYSLVNFGSCFAGVIIISGLKLMKLGKKNIIKSFSRDIPFDYDASKAMFFIPRWLSRFGFNLKMSIVNIIRRKGEFKRYLVIFTTIFVIIFSIGLASFVIGTSSQEWIKKSQGENIIVVGHEDVVMYYSQMYEMFSDPQAFVQSDDINFTSEQYIFNSSEIDSLDSLFGIETIDKRLISFCNISEATRTYGYETVGSDRTGFYPVIGVNSSSLVTEFELEGTFVPDQISVAVGDALALNFFEDALRQGIKIEDINYSPDVSGIVIDSFYGGYGIYMDLQRFQYEMGYENEINVVLLKITPGSYDSIEANLSTLIGTNLGANFTFILLDSIFNENLTFLNATSLYPLVFIVALAFIGLFSLYNFQKGGLVEKSKDIYVMRAIGMRNKHTRRMLFLEIFFVLIPSLLLSLSIGMILNSVFLLDNARLPSIHVPLLIMLVLGSSALLLGYFVVVPIVRKINQMSIKDFEVY
ncbi:MAG: FtsX-like permease family protein [Promethearchaeota archaeon]